MDKWKAIMQLAEEKFGELVTAQVVQNVKLGRCEPTKYNRPVVALIPELIRIEPTKTARFMTDGAGQVFPLIIRTVVDQDPDATIPNDQNALYQLADIMKQVDIIMAQNQTWGGLATSTRPDDEESVRWLWADVDLAHAAADQKYWIRYQEEDVIDG